MAPKTNNNSKTPTKVNNIVLLKGLNCIPLNLDKSPAVIANIIKIAENIAITPASLLGIDLKTA